MRVNDCVLLFLSYGEPPFDFDILKFSYEKPAVEKSKELLIFGDFRGVLRLQSSYDEDEVYKAVTNYISILRSEKRDLEKYYSFLKNVTKTQHQRLIEDGNSDLMFLFNTCSEIDFYEIVNDNELDSRIRDYIRFVIIPYKEKKLEQEVKQ